MNRGVISLQSYSPILHILGDHNNPFVQTKLVDQHLNLSLMQVSHSLTVQIMGSLTAQSKTGQECRNIFLGLYVDLPLPRLGENADHALLQKPLMLMSLKNCFK